MSKPTDKLCTDTYTINTDYSMKNTTDYEMSCYGYHFAGYWISSDGATKLSSGTAYKFYDTACQVSAAWDRNDYQVKFYVDNFTTSEQFGDTQTVKYRYSAQDPGEPTVEGKHFAGWHQDFTTITSDLSVYADQRNDCYVTYYWNDAKLSNQIGEQEKYWFGKTITYRTIESITARDKHTKTGTCQRIEDYDASISPGLSDDQIVLIGDVENTIQIAIPTKSIEYDGQSHQLTVNITLSPTSQSTQISSMFKVGSGQWTTQIPSFTEIGSYDVQISSTASNYYDNSANVTFTITNENIYNVTFKYQFFNESNDTIEEKTEVIQTQSGNSVKFETQEEKAISASTNYFDFVGFSNDKWKKVASDCEVSAIKSVHQYDINFYKDPQIYGEGHLVDGGEKHSAFHGYVSPPNSPEETGYNFKLWSLEKEDNPTTHTRSSGSGSYIKVAGDADLYAWMVKLIDFKVWQVKNGTRESTPLSTFYNKENYLNTIASSDITLNYGSEYKFSNWYPSPDSSGKWTVSEECSEISAILVPNTGTLTYHSHYPEDSL